MKFFIFEIKRRVDKREMLVLQVSLRRGLAIRRAAVPHMQTPAVCKPKLGQEAPGYLEC